jgi:hypothetical protein
MWKVFREFLKHRACVVRVILKFSELLEAADEKKCHVDFVHEFLKIGTGVKISKKHS